MGCCGVLAEYLSHSVGHNATVISIHCLLILQFRIKSQFLIIFRNQKISPYDFDPYGWTLCVEVIVNNARGITRKANGIATKFIRHCGEINAFIGFFCGATGNCFPIYLGSLMLAEDPGSSTAFDGNRERWMPHCLEKE
jgi:hypothetical protein